MRAPLASILSLVAVALATTALVTASRARAQDPTAPAPAKLDPLDPAHHAAAAAYNAEHGGVSLVVLVKGKVVFEDYPNGGSATDAHELASGTKSFCGALAVAATQDKLLELDEKVSKTIEEWRSDARKEKVTIRQLLSLQSGMEGGTIGRAPPYAEAVSADFTADPGAKFQYGPCPFQTFGAVLKKKLAAKDSPEGVYAYLKRRILDPIGLEVTSWRKDGEDPKLPQGAILRAREWAKFGELVRQRGSFEGKPVLDPALLDECFVGSKANPCYGISFWLNRPIDAQLRASIPLLSRVTDFQYGAAGLPDDLVMAAGAGDQRCYVSRSLDLVVVRQTKRLLQLKRYSDRALLARLLVGKD